MNTIATHMVIWFLREGIEFFYLPTVLSHLFFKLSLKLQFPEAMSNTSVSEVQVAGIDAEEWVVFRVLAITMHPLPNVQVKEE